MERKRKRSLLARIEGQVFGMERADGAATARALQRIAWAINALRGLPQDEAEVALCRHLERRVVALRDAAIEGQPKTLLAQRCTLIRTDCLLWQLRLRRANKDPLPVAEA